MKKKCKDDEDEVKREEENNNNINVDIKSATIKTKRVQNKKAGKKGQRKT